MQVSDQRSMPDFLYHELEDHTDQGNEEDRRTNRTDLAQYRELAAFAQFGSELDDDTKERLDQGERIRDLKTATVSAITS